MLQFIFGVITYIKEFVIGVFTGLFTDIVIDMFKA